MVELYAGLGKQRIKSWPAVSGGVTGEHLVSVTVIVWQKVLSQPRLVIRAVQTVYVPGAKARVSEMPVPASVSFTVQVTESKVGALEFIGGMRSEGIRLIRRCAVVAVAIS